MIPTTEPAVRIAAMYRRRPTTPWSEKEVRTYKKLVKAGFFSNLEDLKLIERYYFSERKKGENGIYRRDLQTFLNNFTGELDRARAWNEEQHERMKRRSVNGTTNNNNAEPVNDEEFKRLGEIAIQSLRELREKLKGTQASL